MGLEGDARSVGGAGREHGAAEKSGRKNVLFHFKILFAENQRFTGAFFTAL